MIGLKEGEMLRGGNEVLELAIAGVEDWGNVDPLLAMSACERR
jgi:hypothetical protein